MVQKSHFNWAAACVVAGLVGLVGCVSDVAVSAAAAPRVVRVHEVQGEGLESPLTGQIVTVRGVVTGFFRGAKGGRDGIYLQETKPDKNPATSEGIYVHVGGAQGAGGIVDTLALGDVVEVTGKVDEFNGLTQLKFEGVAEATMKRTGTAALPAPVEVRLPVKSATELERYEGMRVRFPQTLTVTGNYTLGQYGELYLSSEGVNVQPTNVIDPNDEPATGTTSTGGSNAHAIASAQQRNVFSTILLDDANAKAYPEPTPYLSEEHTRRLGDTVTNLTGVLTYRFNAYRVDPEGAVNFKAVNVRPQHPPKLGNASLTVASANVLNYFTTLGPGGRGASNAEELERQREKIVAALAAMNADVVGLMEIERKKDNAPLVDLVAALNRSVGAGTYAYVDSSAIAGTDMIQLALIYKPRAVTPVGVPKTDTAKLGIHQRPPLAQTFQAKSSGEKLTVVVNHFKSKGGGNSAQGLDKDQNDGQAAYNELRRQQARALAEFVAKPQEVFGDPDVLIIGDLNAYAEEDPVDILRASGFVDLLQRFEPKGYSYQYGQQVGYLDHALANTSLATQVTATAHWHINADEPAFLDYNTENKTAAQAAVNVRTPFRSSDHDPVMIGLRLK